MAPLPELSAISNTLNDESNRVNALLNEFERKLCALNLGVEAWVTDQTLKDRRVVETYEKYGEGELYRSYDQQLGFGQIGAHSRRRAEDARCTGGGVDGGSETSGAVDQGGGRDDRKTLR